MSIYYNLDHNMSLYIPHVFPNITFERMRDIFEKYEFGIVKKIDFVEKIGKDGEYKAAYVHFESWNTKIKNISRQMNIVKGNYKLIYDKPWHWVILENKGKKHIPGERKQRIDLSEKSNIAPGLDFDEFTSFDVDSDRQYTPKYSDAFGEERENLEQQIQMLKKENEKLKYLNSVQEEKIELLNQENEKLEISILFQKEQIDNYKEEIDLRDFMLNENLELEEQNEYHK